MRKGVHLPTVTVVPASGVAQLESTGESLYREVQVSLRQAWSEDAQLFISYVHASNRGDTNDFGMLFTNLDAAFLEPNSMSVTQSDVPDRLRAWATVGLPRRIVVSPSVDWRTGFPYSNQDQYRHYVGEPNSERFPVSFIVISRYSRPSIFRPEDGYQGSRVFDLTDHFDPTRRDFGRAIVPFW